MLWRKNITNDQTQAATYNVYANSTSMMKSLSNPAPIVPAINDPGLGTQGTVVPRTNVTLIGNEAPNTFNQLGWITDNANGTNGTTDGNAVEAGLDIDGINGVDPNGKADGTNRVFNFDYNPAPGNPAPGDAPTLPAYRNGAMTQLFYLNNRYHDELYKLGFTEAARNFQNVNFTGMGVAGDRVSAEGQDSSGTNNANFGTPADGGRGRMQMYIFTGPNPDYDGDIDGDIVVHEHTHGLSNRLVGNGSGLSNNRGGSMGEGWSDFLRFGFAFHSRYSGKCALYDRQLGDLFAHFRAIRITIITVFAAFRMPFCRQPADLTIVRTIHRLLRMLIRRKLTTRTGRSQEIQCSRIQRRKSTTPAKSGALPSGKFALNLSIVSARASEIAKSFNSLPMD